VINVLIIPPCYNTGQLFYSSVPAEAVTIAILKYASFHRLCCLMNRKVKSFKQTVSEYCAVSIVTTSLDTAPQSFCRSFTALSIIRRSKSTQKFAVQVCHIATVVMETTQLVLSQFKNFLPKSTDN